MTGTKCGTIAIAGRPNVGKSSLMNALVGQPLSIVSAKAQATRSPVIGLRIEGPNQFVFRDLPGLLDPTYLLQTRMVEMALRELAEADAVLYLHPGREAPAPSLPSLLPAGSRLRRRVVTVYTKADLLDQASIAALDAPAVSATSGAGLGPLLELLASVVPPGPWLYPADDLGTQPTGGEHGRRAGLGRGRRGGGSLRSGVCRRPRIHRAPRDAPPPAGRSRAPGRRRRTTPRRAWVR